jgi:rare lipoprotein A
VKSSLSFFVAGTVLPAVCALPVLAGSESGVASVYSFEAGARTASGQPLDPDALTAAHRTLPFGTKVRVTNTRNGLVAVVTINDRGPFVRGRVIDLTPAGARALGFSGLAPVTIETIRNEAGSPSLPGSPQAGNARDK